MRNKAGGGGGGRMGAAAPKGVSQTHFLTSVMAIASKAYRADRRWRSRRFTRVGAKSLPGSLGAAFAPNRFPIFEAETHAKREH